MGGDGAGAGARPAGPGDADELLRLRVTVLDGGPLDEEWRATFHEDMRARLGRDPDLLAFVVPAGGGLAACAIGIVYRGYRGPSHPTGRWGGSTRWSPVRPESCWMPARWPLRWGQRLAQ
ncbi:hypothetical protein ABTX81_28205 [Kitasatospora sp. NPDC097605]|uniref:hypothetical protein n=1 Tax=Kitasatospora sp. NPDC097605 TaxID=3157226 RepID=UPI00332AA5FF